MEMPKYHILVIQSKNQPKESKNLIAFCKYYDINYEVSELENFAKDDSFGSIGLLVGGSFFNYESFKKYHIDISKTIKREEKNSSPALKIH
jgi:hypothetical protein